jgi:DNA-directed RNA polymerase specialized sigma24 family protein
MEMKHLEGRKVAQIATEMGLSAVAVNGLLRRGLEKLRKLLAEDA